MAGARRRRHHPAVRQAEPSAGRQSDVSSGILKASPRRPTVRRSSPGGVVVRGCRGRSLRSAPPPNFPDRIQPNQERVPGRRAGGERRPLGKRSLARQQIDLLGNLIGGHSYSLMRGRGFCFATGTGVVGAFAADPAKRTRNRTGARRPSGVPPGDGIQSPPPRTPARADPAAGFGFGFGFGSRSCSPGSRACAP